MQDHLSCSKQFSDCQVFQRKRAIFDLINRAILLNKNQEADLDVSVDRCMLINWTNY